MYPKHHMIEVVSQVQLPKTVAGHFHMTLEHSSICTAILALLEEWHSLAPPEML